MSDKFFEKNGSQMDSFAASFSFSGSFLDSLILVSSLKGVNFIEFYCRNCIFPYKPTLSF